MKVQSEVKCCIKKQSIYLRLFSGTYIQILLWSVDYNIVSIDYPVSSSNCHRANFSFVVHKLKLTKETDGSSFGVEIISRNGLIRYIENIFRCIHIRNFIANRWGL